MSRSMAGSPTQRLVSVDVLRGIVMAGMILVNNPGTWNSVYGPLLHAHWNGWTLTDLVFPSFLFLVGVSIPLAFDRRLSEGQRPSELFIHAVQRAVMIFAFWLILFGLPDLRLIGPYLLIVAAMVVWRKREGTRTRDDVDVLLSRRPTRAIVVVLLLLTAVVYFILDFHHFQETKLRMYGVLPRIAMCYLIASAAALLFGATGRVAMIVVILVGYWLILDTFSAPPEYTAPVGGPDGLLHDWIDSRVAGAHVFFERPDPEGLLSTLPAVATALLGTLAGALLASGRGLYEKICGLLLGGTLLLLLGVALNRYIPINKKLWSDSFVLFTGGFAACAIAWCMWVVDMRGWRRWAAPFLVFGTNAILVYCLSTLLNEVFKKIILKTSDGVEITFRKWLYEHLFAPLASPLNSSLLYAITYVLLWLIVFTPLYRKRIFIRV